MANITVAGAGYVGMSLAVLLAQKNNVKLIDIIPEKISLVNQRISPVKDEYIENYLAGKKLYLSGTADPVSAYSSADFIIIAVPTNYNEATSEFDTSAVESVIESVNSVNPEAIIVIKSTVPVGYTQNISKKYPEGNFLFCPEFLRESKALYDNLYPSRIIIGAAKEDPVLTDAKYQFVELLEESALKEEIPVLFMDSTEAEAVKLFANTCLALRIAYFNELDTYAEKKGLCSKDIIEGVSLDPRIGDYYNNPSFGYGGYCLPKDTRQLLHNFSGVPQTLISAIIKSNDTRMDYIAEHIMDHLKNAGHLEHPLTVGIYRLTMKKDSDNFRSSSIQGVLSRLEAGLRRTYPDIRLIIYEPSLTDGSLWEQKEIVNDIDSFKKESDYIIANRFDSILDNVKDKVYTRDIFGSN